MMSGFVPNGVKPEKAASIPKVLDQDRWSRAEERAAEMLTYVQPNLASEQRRNDVLSYLRRLITNNCVSCQVFPVGSVPLKTYLPDGDIDLAAFSKNQHWNDDLVNEVRNLLESEEKSEHAEFRVKEVQYIQAEVKIVKCLVENFVVDISFNQLAGLCTLCFLEEVDNVIGQNHLLKRSVILIKAWCYYESRILGAHHGLMSTYALETLVIYIFHVYNKTFAGPLEVLYRFLEFFSKFDWDNYCISLWGPVPKGSLPNMRADPPRKDCQGLLLNETFLNACMCCYGVPRSLENQEQPFVSKYFNIVDPLRGNNNLGRSVSQGNFFRIRSAISFGEKRLVRLLDCPEEKLIAEFDFFFKNTWDRNGNGYWIPCHELYARNNNVENSTNHESEVEQPQASNKSHGAYQKPTTHLKESQRLFGTTDVSAVPETWSSKTNSIGTSTLTSDIMHTNPMKNALIEQGQSSKYSSKSALTDEGQSSKSSSNEVHAMNHFNRVHSSPEFSPTQHMHTWASGRESGQIHSASSMAESSRRSGSTYEVSDNLNILVLPANQQSLGKTSYNQRRDGAVDLRDASNGYYCEFGSDVNSENGYFVDEAMHMLQEDNAFMNSAETFRNCSFNGSYLQAPVNVNSSNVSLPPCGELPVNAPYFDSFWGHNLPYSQDSVPFPAFAEPHDYNIEVANLDHGNIDGAFWLEQDMNNLRLCNGEDGNVQAQQQSEKQMLAASASNVATDLAMHNSSVDTTFILAGPSGENQGLFPHAFGPNVPPFPFPIIMDPFCNLPAERFDVLDGDFASHWMNMQHGRFCVHGKPQGPLFPALPLVPPMQLQLLEQFPRNFPNILPSANMNNMAQSYPLLPMLPIGPVSGSHVGINPLGFAGLFRHRVGTGTYMPDPESYKIRFKWHGRKRYNRPKDGRFNYEYERKHGGGEGNQSYNSNERFGNLVWKPMGTRTDISIGLHNGQCNASIDASCSTTAGTNEASDQGDGSQCASNDEQANSEKDSADSSSDQPSWPNISGIALEDSEPINEE